MFNFVLLGNLKIYMFGGKCIYKNESFFLLVLFLVWFVY